MEKRNINIKVYIKVRVKSSTLKVAGIVDSMKSLEKNLSVILSGKHQSKIKKQPIDDKRLKIAVVNLLLMIFRSRNLMSIQE